MGKNIRKIRQIRTEQITNTETHGNTRMQMNRDSVTLRDNPCSSKNIRSIRQIRTEQITNTDTHGNTRMQMSKIIRKIRKIRTEQKTTKNSAQ